jgi:hypothetical protein
MGGAVLEQEDSAMMTAEKADLQMRLELATLVIGSLPLPL